MLKKSFKRFGHKKFDNSREQCYIQTIISITDNGSGIPDKLKSKIFEPKFTTKSAGMGLGLGIVKNIIKSHNGKISFVSTHQKGTTFSIVLPKD